MEHTQNTFSQIAFAQLHIFCVLAGKKCVNLHKLCVIYTFLGRREALVDHRHKSQITFTQIYFYQRSLPLTRVFTCIGNALGKENTRTRPMTWNRNVDLMKCDLLSVFYVRKIKPSHICANVLYINAICEKVFWVCSSIAV